MLPKQISRKSHNNAKNSCIFTTCRLFVYILYFVVAPNAEQSRNVQIGALSLKYFTTDYEQSLYNFDTQSKITDVTGCRNIQYITSITRHILWNLA